MLRRLTWLLYYLKGFLVCYCKTFDLKLYFVSSIGHLKFGAIFLFVGNSQLFLYANQSHADRLFITQSGVLLTVRLIVKSIEEAVLHINRSYVTNSVWSRFMICVVFSCEAMLLMSYHMHNSEAYCIYW